MNRKPHYFASGTLDRASHIRTDTAWLEKQLAAAQTLWVPMWKSKNYFCNGKTVEPMLLTRQDISTTVIDDEQVIFLGMNGEKPLFALDFSHADDPLELVSGCEEVIVDDLKLWGAVLHRDTAALLAYARGMLLWQKRYQFCGTCGHRTRAQAGGHHRVCGNKDCGAHYFSRTDPAVIVQITRDDQILLGRQPNWKKGVYSTLAGFVEPGESLEDAVRREVYEEAGIVVGQIRYHSSQPWPFPSSLMLGFTAVAENTNIHLTDDELEDACWFTREEIRIKIRSGEMHLPSDVSIARRLVEDWLDEENSSI